MCVGTSGIFACMQACVAAGMLQQEYSACIRMLTSLCLRKHTHLVRSTQLCKDKPVSACAHVLISFSCLYLYMVISQEDMAMCTDLLATSSFDPSLLHAEAGADLHSSSSFAG